MNIQQSVRVLGSLSYRGCVLALRADVLELLWSAHVASLFSVLLTALLQQRRNVTVSVTHFLYSAPWARADWFTARATPRPAQIWAVKVNSWVGGGISTVRLFVLTKHNSNFTALWWHLMWHPCLSLIISYCCERADCVWQITVRLWWPYCSWFTIWFRLPISHLFFFFF